MKPLRSWISWKWDEVQLHNPVPILERLSDQLTELNLGSKTWHQEHQSKSRKYAHCLQKQNVDAMSNADVQRFLHGCIHFGSLKINCRIGNLINPEPKSNPLRSDGCHMTRRRSPNDLACWRRTAAFLLGKNGQSVKGWFSYPKKILWTGWVPDMSSYIDALRNPTFRCTHAQFRTLNL